MKWFLNLLVICGAGFFGYVAEPFVRLELTGISPFKKIVTPQGDPQAQAIAKINLLDYSPEQMPKEVLLKKDAKVTDSVSGTKMTIPAETRVKVVRLEDGMVVISPGAAAIEGAVDVTATDIREQLLGKEPGAPVEPPKKRKADKPALTDPMAKEDPAPAPAETPAVDPNNMKDAAAPAAPAETAAADPNMKDAAPAPNPALAPEAPAAPAPAAAPEAAFAPLGKDEIVQIMQDSIKAEQIKEFKFAQVSEWTAAEPETVEGKQMNVGLVTYKGTTFLGVKNIQAKAYIAGGKVTKWIMPKSGMEIK